jgi:arabinan endo-1,5-alpha-L-arabinosidase
MKKLILLIFLLQILKISHSQTCDFSLFKGPDIFDTYQEYYNNESKWAGFNVHDPTVYKDGDYYYMYNTDVALGLTAVSGCMKRRSKDLVNWEFLGRAFPDVPQSAKNFFLPYNPSYTNSGIWAPFLTKYKNEFRLYYSAPGGLANQNLAFLGYATSSSANGPWTDKGKITGSVPGDTINAIDPTVVVDRITGRHWMAYGSYQNGIYVVELDSTSGGLKTTGDRGIKIAGRNGGRNAAIEGPEINYRNGWYYLFVSYDWLEDFYNVRVGRSRNPNGPYLDFNGVNMALYSDNVPMIEAPYQFNNHEGWQGTGHCSVYNDNGTYYIFNQARPSTSIYNMDLHVRKMYWINDWPVLSPERYAGVPQCTITADSLVGKWENLELIYSKVLAHSTSTTIELSSNRTIDNNALNTWSLQDSTLALSFNSGQKIYKTIVSFGWDWENRCVTMLYTGINGSGICTWGKKINQQAIDTYTKISSGATYLIRNHYSNMVMEVPTGADTDGTPIQQNTDNGDKTQLWKLMDAGNGYYQFVSANSNSSRVIEVINGNNVNGANLILGSPTNTDKQKFKIIYNDNGYFHIVTKVSSDNKCFDLNNFSILPGGNIFQWDFLSGVNQAWRFKKVEAVNNATPVKQFTDVGNNFQIYPNPSTGGAFNVSFEKLNIKGAIVFTVFNATGENIYKETLKSDQIHYFHLNLLPGIYLIRVYSNGKQYLNKLVVN